MSILLFGWITLKLSIQIFTECNLEILSEDNWNFNQVIFYWFQTSCTKYVSESTQLQTEKLVLSMFNMNLIISSVLWTIIIIISNYLTKFWNKMTLNSVMMTLSWCFPWLKGSWNWIKSIKKMKKNILRLRIKQQKILFGSQFSKLFSSVLLLLFNFTQLKNIYQGNSNFDILLFYISFKK